MKMKHKNFFFFIMAAMLLFACGQADTAPANPTSVIRPVDKLFIDFYKRQGGEEILGNAISELQINAELKIQYLETSVMVFNPLAETNLRYYFKALGTELGFYEEAPGRNYPQATDSVIDGYVIYPAFISIYQAFGGEKFAGKLISSWDINESGTHIEQHFENLGFYILLEDAKSDPKLLPYGLLACGTNCLTNTGLGSGLISGNQLREPFAKDALNYGDELLGSHLFGAYQNPDGNEEVIFENAVLIAPNGSDRSSPRPIAVELGYDSQVLVAPLNNPNTTFVLIRNGLGHNIPNFFIEYMQEMGNPEFYGLPISEFEAISSSVFQQCFTNICLEYHSVVDGDLQQIKPSPLGYQYHSEIFSSYGIDLGPQVGIETPAFDNPNPIIEDPTPTTPAITAISGQLTVWENKALLSSQESQIIYVSVFDGSTPFYQLDLVLKYFSASIETQEFYFPSTDKNGYTEITLPTIVANNGEIIHYQVCPKDLDSEISCINDSFIIWGN